MIAVRLFGFPAVRRPHHRVDHAFYIGVAFAAPLAAALWAAAVLAVIWLAGAL